MDIELTDRQHIILKAIIQNYLETGELLPEPDMEERKRMILRHAELMVKYKSEYIAIPEMRKHLAWYTAGIPGSAKLRAGMNSLKTLDELKSFVNEAL